MIYAHTSDGGILLGLSARNLELLQQGKPILLRPSSTVLPPVRIYYCETEEQLMIELIKHGALPAAEADGTPQ